MEEGRRAILRRAVAIVGDRAVFARQAQVRPIILDGYLAGPAPIPEKVFLHAVDIILAEGQRMQDSDETGATPNV